MKYLLILVFSSSLLFSQERFIKGYIGFQKETVNILESSDIAYIFLLNDENIDFVSLKKAKRIINRDIKRVLKRIYKKAIAKGIISKNSIYNSSC